MRPPTESRAPRSRRRDTRSETESGRGLRGSTAKPSPVSGQTAENGHWPVPSQGLTPVSLKPSAGARWERRHAPALFSTTRPGIRQPRCEQAGAIRRMAHPSRRTTRYRQRGSGKGSAHGRCRTCRRPPWFLSIRALIPPTSQSTPGIRPFAVGIFLPHHGRDWSVRGFASPEPGLPAGFARFHQRVRVCGQQYPGGIRPRRPSTRLPPYSPRCPGQVVAVPFAAAEASLPTAARTECGHGERCP